MTFNAVCDFSSRNPAKSFEPGPYTGQKKHARDAREKISKDRHEAWRQDRRSVGRRERRKIAQGIYNPAGVSPILPARFERIFAIFLCSTEEPGDRKNEVTIKRTNDRKTNCCFAALQRSNFYRFIVSSFYRCSWGLSKNKKI